MIISVKFGQNPSSDSGDVVWRNCWRQTNGRRPITTAHHDHFMLRWGNKTQHESTVSILCCCINCMCVHTSYKTTVATQRQWTKSFSVHICAQYMIIFLTLMRTSLSTNIIVYLYGINPFFENKQYTKTDYACVEIVY
jgi:hypothetical protein